MLIIIIIKLRNDPDIILCGFRPNNFLNTCSTLYKVPDINQSTDKLKTSI